MLATVGLSKFYNGLKTAKEKADFRGHLRRYLQIYLPDCPFEVNSTNRYTIVSHEAAVTARRFIRRNETIKYLAGIQVVITPEEEREMTARNKDFSIVVSSRNKCASLFMGPARFANHDCEANAKLVTTGHAGIEIIATTSIDVGDEITVTYADNYFGSNNSECLCRTCESRQVNGWANPDEPHPVKPSIEGGQGEPMATEEYSLRRRRPDRSVDSVSRRALTLTPGPPTPNMRPRISRSRPSRRSSTNRDSIASDASTASNASNDKAAGKDSPMPPVASSLTKKRAHTDTIITPPFTPSKKVKLSESQSAAIPIHLESSRSVSSQSARCSSHGSSDGGAPSTDMTSPPSKESPDPLVIYSPRPLRTPRKISVLKREDSDEAAGDVLSQMTLFDALPRGPTDGRHVPVPDAPRDSGNLATPPSSQESACEESLATCIPSIEPIADPTSAVVPKSSIETTGEQETTREQHSREQEDAKVAQEEGVPKKRKYQRRRFIKETTPPARNRTPGDYTLTGLLLSEPEMAWVRCMVCETAFVQRDAYFTKSSCPRCERHSKLYGYVWPKTEKAGPRDKEERILDHRVVHRYLDPESEARVRGRKRRGSKAATTPSVSEEAAATKKGVAAKEGPSRAEAAATPLRRSGRARRVSSRIAAY